MEGEDQAGIDGEDEAALIKEIEIIKSLDHPNIMKVYEYFDYNDCLYIVSELCTGGELFDKIQSNKCLNEKVAGYVMKQILSAVEFCHKNKIIHRDLKPENILIESEEEVRKEFFSIKIIDFGTSDKLVKGKMLKKQIGTPLYIAPEVLEGDYNEKCDLWSCGVILYMMLCGEAPFKGDTDEEIYSSIRRGIINFNQEEWDYISNDAKDLIKKLLTIDFNQRISAKEALNHSWIVKMKNERQKLDTNILIKAIENIRKYSATKKLQQASLAYIVHNLILKKDTDDLRRIFIYFDDDADGRLTKDELIKGLNLILNEDESEKEVNRLMDIIDVDGNGSIEYEEFLRAGLDKSIILTEENLKTAFQMFDICHRNRINSKELKEVLGSGAQNVDDNVWKE